MKNQNEKNQTCNDCETTIGEGEACSRFIIVGDEEVGVFVLCLDCAQRVAGRNVEPLSTIERTIVAFEVLSPQSVELLDMITRNLGLTLWDIYAKDFDEKYEMFEGTEKASEMKLLLPKDNDRATKCFQRTIDALNESVRSLENLVDLIRAGASIVDLRVAVTTARKSIAKYSTAVDEIDAQPDPEAEGANELERIVRDGISAHEKMDSTRMELATASLERWGDESAEMLIELFDGLLE